MGINPKLLVSILLLIVCLPVAITAKTAGPNSPVIGINVAVGGTAWSNSGKVTISDNSYASVSGFIANSDALVASNFGFAIPGTATIDGITVVIERNRAGIAVIDNTVHLTKNGTTPVGSNTAAGGNWPNTDGNAIYGNATDLWGTTWTSAEVNSSTFGVYIIVGFAIATASVDHVTVTIDYSVGTPS